MSADLIARGLAARNSARLVAARADGIVYNRPALAAWHAALANRANAPAKVAWVGDSITEGVAAPLGARWVDRALAALRSAYPTPGVVGGLNYLPSEFQSQRSGAPTPAHSYASLTGGTLGFNNNNGLGARCLQFNASGDGCIYNVTCSSFDVHYLKGPPLGPLSIQIDAGAATVLSTTAGTYAPAIWTSPALTPGVHTITATASGSGAVQFNGLVLYNGDEAAGIQGYEAGHFGWKTGDFAAAQVFTWQPFSSILPHLVTIALGTNDYNNQVPIATFRANFQTIIAVVRAQAPAASIALVMYPRRGDIAVQPIGWDQYVRACYEVSDADTGGINGASGVAVIDLSTRLPNAALSGTVDALGIYATDRVHLTTKGHAAVGEMVAGAVRV